MLRITAMPAGPGGVEYLLSGAGCAHAVEASSPESYYLKGAADREPLGWWLGNGLNDLGLPDGEEVTPEEIRALFGELCAPNEFLHIVARAEEMIDELGLTDRAAHEARETALEEARAASRLGAPPRKYRTPEARAEEKIAKAEKARGGSLEPEERAAIQSAARADTRQARGYFDMTFSAAKSVSVLHAALLVDGREAEAAAVIAGHRAGVAAAMAYLQDTAGLTRTGYHGRGRDGAGPAAGKWVEAKGWISAEFMHFTSREGEPQIHSHVAVLNRVRVVDEHGKETWKTIDAAGAYAARAAAGAVYERAMEQYIEQVLPVVFDMREDGLSREVRGIDAEVRDAFSTRRAQVVAARDAYAAEFETQYGREPTAYELTKISELAALSTRKDKEQALSPEQMIERYRFLAQSRLETTLPEVANRAFLLGGAAKAERILNGPEEIDHEKVIREALAEVQKDRATWRRTDLIQALNRKLPDGWTPAQVAEQAVTADAALEHLADCALSGGWHDTVMVAGHQLIAVPEELRRPDGRSVYQGAAIEADWFATVGHLSTEDRIVARAHAIGAPALAETTAHEVAEAHTLSGDQARAAIGALTDGRSVSVIVGPAGAGKTRAQRAISEAWTGATGRRVVGLAPSNVAATVLGAEAKLTETSNTSRYVANLNRAAAGKPHDATLIPRYGDLIIVDEAGMASTAHLSKIIDAATRAGAKVLLAGDYAQLGSPEAGGMFRQLAEDGIGTYELDTVRRFREPDGKVREWEAAGSLKLRVGDWRALPEYQAQGRIHGGTREEMIAEIADRYARDVHAERDAVVVCSTNEAASEASAAIRTRLVRIRKVEEEGSELVDGNRAGRGDRIQTRENEYSLVDDAGLPVYNRFVYEVEDRADDGSLSVRRVTGRDEDTGEIVYAGAVTLPADYVREYVALAYAGTGNAVQGVTTTIGYALVDGSSNREGIYVGLTRGTLENHAFVITVSEADTQEDHGHDEDSETTESHPTTVLAGAMRREGSQQSATATLRASVDHAASGSALLPRWTMTVADWHRARVDAELLPLLGTELYERLHEEGSAPVYARIRETELAGHDVVAVLREAIGMREMTTSESVPALLTWRIERALEDREPEQPPQGEDWVSRIPTGLGGELGEYVLDTAGAIEARREVLGERLAENPPEWAVERIGPVPEDVDERAEWTRRAGTVELYRETYTPEDAISVLGPAPGRGAVEQRLAWRDAAASLSSNAEDGEIRTADNEQLLAIVREAAEASRTAPEHVAENLEAFVRTRDHYDAQAQIRDIEHQHAAAEMTPEQAQAEEVRIQAYRDLAELTGQYATEYGQRHQERAEWYTSTAAVRERAAAARMELETRGIDPDAPEPVPAPQVEPFTWIQPALFELDDHDPAAAAELDDERELAEDEQHQEREHGQEELVIEPVFQPERYGMEQVALFELDEIRPTQREAVEETAEQVEELTRTVADHVDQVRRQRAAVAQEAETAEQVAEEPPGQTIEQILEAPGIGHVEHELVLGIDGPELGM